MSFWWFEPSWKETLCASCGAKIWPEGDPDWGYCYECFNRRLQERDEASDRAQREEARRG